MKLQPTEIHQLLGVTLRNLRIDRRWTQEELAERAGMHPHYISDIERGKRNVGLVNLTYLAEAFEMTAADLLASAGL
jgi:transcriptional regulator with XRE-family HTH domain